MSRTKHLIAIIAAVLACLTSCGGGSTADSLEGAEVISMKYARLLTLHEGEGFVLAEIKNPWDTTKILHRYLLVPKVRKRAAGASAYRRHS